MNNDELKNKYPKLSAKVEDLDELRSLVVVDENYSDQESDDTEEFEPDEFNYMIYIPEQTVVALGSEALERLASKLEDDKNIDDFLASEEDLFGVQTNLNQDEIAKVVLNFMESELS